MCGRFALFTPPARLSRYFQATLAEGVAPEGRPRWNVAPTDGVLGVRQARPPQTSTGGGHRVMDQYRWGLVPPWAKDPSVGNRLFNARSEGIATKASFRSAFRSRRLVIPSDGFYEWHTGPDGRRQPYYFFRADGDPIAFAGLWEGWRDPRPPEGAQAWLHSCTIITTNGGPDMAGIHDRMPVVLDPAHLDAWLDPGNEDAAQLEALLRPTPGGTLAHRPADRRVGNVRNDDPALIDPALIDPALIDPGPDTDHAPAEGEAFQQTLLLEPDAPADRR